MHLAVRGRFSLLFSIDFISGLRLGAFLPSRARAIPDAVRERVTFISNFGGSLRDQFDAGTCVSLFLPNKSKPLKYMKRTVFFLYPRFGVSSDISVPDMKSSNMTAPPIIIFQYLFVRLIFEHSWISDDDIRLTLRHVFGSVNF